ncbi:aminotransferase class III, putative [Babesia ovata]|uniref:Aminotransferase class III, putative n=1 Tax=Babesia ovata TaxID=189622 RepID=A0A2H6KEJ1_9APIC|nr:aminotransferase class III, putative [Babesia ovata]GBE61405.1 aminotransferase class III, putative [Babesia ovata]
MGRGILDTLDQILDTLHSSSQCSGEGWQHRITNIRRALYEQRGAIESSNDPLMEGFPHVFVIPLLVDQHSASSHVPQTASDPNPSTNSNVSQMLELMRNQIDAVAGAQIHALSRQSPRGTQAHPSPLMSPELGPRSISLPEFATESLPPRELYCRSSARGASVFRSDGSSQTEPVVAETVIQPSRVSRSQSGTVISGFAGDDNVEEAGPPVAAATSTTDVSAATTESHIYVPLASLKHAQSSISMYVVAVEMIRSNLRSTRTQTDFLNYRAIDPSVYGTAGNKAVDFSVQILLSNDSKHFHVNYGDVIRLRRVNAEFVTDKSGKKHVNIIMNAKNFSAIRIWPNDACRVTQDPQEPDVSAASEPVEDKCKSKRHRPDALEKLASEALVIYGGTRTRVDDVDLEMVTKLRTWVRDTLDAKALTTNPEFARTIADAGPCGSDFIVCVLDVSPEPGVNLLVSDASSMAVVMGLNDILVSNLLESHNRVQPGEWLKLRYVQRSVMPFKRADGTNHVALTASNFSTVTRLPILDLPYIKPVPPTAARSKKLRRVTRMKMWNEASGLNRQFPLRLRNSTGYVNRLLQYTCTDDGVFEKVTRSSDVEVEEGEIQPTVSPQ